MLKTADKEFTSWGDFLECSLGYAEEDIVRDALQQGAVLKFMEEAILVSFRPGTVNSIFRKC